ncbi:MAG TPA: sugar phosphate isomerase/epimerase family protein [Gemmatimonadales bacterium]|jgi:sugar phosphate isomerase/epimerase|nr:sugar phosphate isomerase/epimerase family protein [Gemmatimonadales bacterium]
MTPFRLSVLTDEITQDLGRACEIAAREFGLGYVELRGAFNKNILNWDAHDVAEARRTLERYRLRVSELASPIFKVDWPGAPKSTFSPSGPQFSADFTYAQQDELLGRAVDLAHAFQTPYVRVFDFWRLEDQAPYRAAMDDRLRQAAIAAGQRGVTLTIENEAACNTATGAEAGRLLAAVTERSLMLNWDAGNATAKGETAYPDGYAKLPKDRIAHLHCKDVVRTPDGKTAWAAMGRGIIDWVGQFRALKRDGYRGVLSLETHWRGAGTPEESSRQSMAGMKQLLKQVE